jgi:SAM-dependent methyltransferase
MHVESLNEMRKNLDKFMYSEMAVKVLDVGSMTIKNKGSYRQLMLSNWSYMGLDVEQGPNVDVVAKDGKFPLNSGMFDVVLSGQCFEHVKNPFKLMAECSRVLKPGGLFFGVAPYKWKMHRYPVDCWRFLPDGWIALFEESGIENIKSYILDHAVETQADCWGIGRKI